LRVIVQQQGVHGDLEAEVARLGGQVVLDLSLINAFAAELPGQAVLALAQNPAVRFISLDAPVITMGKPEDSVAALANIYIQSIGADQAWKNVQGKNVSVAVIDSGIDGTSNRGQGSDFGNPGRKNASRVVNVAINKRAQGAHDVYGHGTYVAGIIGGNGSMSRGKYIGVAPKAKLINVKVTNDQGAAMESDVVAGLQWVYNNRIRYNIRVLNISLNASTPLAYDRSPLDAALEVLWFNTIVVVVSAGNSGPAQVLYPPANDPFVITVGAADDKGTPSVDDDTLQAYTARGLVRVTDQISVFKPEIIAPGKNLVSVLADITPWEYQYPNRITDEAYFRLSGTSAASAVVAGAAALLLDAEPRLNPDQVKYRLTQTGSRSFTFENQQVPYVNIANALRTKTTATANTGLKVSHLLTTGSKPVTWPGLTWNSIEWASIEWASIEWASIEWASIEWASDWWGD